MNCKILLGMLVLMVGGCAPKISKVHFTEENTIQYIKNESFLYNSSDKPIIDGYEYGLHTRTPDDPVNVGILLKIGQEIHILNAYRIYSHEGGEWVGVTGYVEFEEKKITFLYNWSIGGMLKIAPWEDLSVSKDRKINDKLSKP